MKCVWLACALLPAVATVSWKWQAGMLRQCARGALCIFLTLSISITSLLVHAVACRGAGPVWDQACRVAGGRLQQGNGPVQCGDTILI